MAKDDEHEAALRRAAEHVARTRARLADGRARLEQAHETVQQTNEHMTSMAAWIDETERQLRAAREAAGAADSDSAA